MASLRDVVRAVRALPPKDLARGLARAPLVVDAERRLSELSWVELSELVGGRSVDVSLAAPDSRHSWSLGVAEQFALQALIAARGPRSAFEIGTFNGGTTRLLAEALPAEGCVVTLDLPPEEFDRSQAPDSFSGAQVGRAYTDSPAAGKVTQLLADSLAFDASPYAGQFDLVLVDGGHEHAHGVADTLTALRLVGPGGLIVWDDFEPYWHGLVRGIIEAMDGRELRRLRGTAFGIYLAP